MYKKKSRELMSQIPIDHNYTGESDSLDDEASSIVAVASTVDSFRYENGRRYHAFRDGSYWGANDEINAAYEKVLHHLLLKAMKDKLFLAPIENPKRVNDLGTGTGLWAMDMADKYESSEILGIDLSPAPPTPQPNLQFEVDDVTSEWTHSQSFDLIHIRCLYGSVEDWGQLYKQCLEHLEPGGYIEQVEFSIIPQSDDGSLTPDHIVYRWQEIAEQCSPFTGKSFMIADTMKNSIEKAGFVDVVEHKLKFPLGSWSSDEDFKILGKWFKQLWWAGMENWILALSTRHLNWTPDDVRKLVQETKRALEDRSQHIYYNGVVVYGRRP